MVTREATDHVLRLENATGLAVLAVVGCRDEPEMFAAAHSARAVLGAHAEYLSATLRKDPEHRSGLTVGAGDEVADSQRADLLEPARSEDKALDRLRAAAHECQRRHLDHAALEMLVYALGLEHVVERVEERPQVGIDLGGDVTGEEAEPLARLDSGPGQDDAVDLAA